MIAVIKLTGKRTGISREIKVPVESTKQARGFVRLLRATTNVKVKLIRIENGVQS